MSKQLKVGDLVRVTAANRMNSYQPGDKGTVLWGGTKGTSGQRYFVVSMDKAGATGTTVVFTEKEVEPDV
jgi:hypothetical protein